MRFDTAPGANTECTAQWWAIGLENRGDRKVRGSTPRRSANFAWVCKWSKQRDCKSRPYGFAGSNPCPTHQFTRPYLNGREARCQREDGGSILPGRSMDRLVKEKVTKIAGLLFSDMDGEVVAAARAIRRLVSVHEFVALVEGRNSKLSNAEKKRNPPDQQIIDMVSAMFVNKGMMQPHELKFVEQMKAMALRNKPWQMTEKQDKWFVFLYTKYAV